MNSFLTVHCDVVAAIAQRFCHPDELVQELVGARDERFVEKLSRFVEYVADVAEI